MTVKEKEKRTGNAIHVQSDTKKHFITGSNLFFKDEISLCEKFKNQGSVN